MPGANSKAGISNTVGVGVLLGDYGTVTQSQSILIDIYNTKLIQ